MYARKTEQDTEDRKHEGWQEREFHYTSKEMSLKVDY